MKRGVLGSLPDKSAASDYYSEGIIIVDVSDPYACPVLWLNSVCKEMLGEYTASLHWQPKFVCSWVAGLQFHTACDQTLQSVMLFNVACGSIYTCRQA